MNIPVLAYHSMRIHGNRYADNDLVALSTDLETIRGLGFRIVQLGEVVRRLRGGGRSYCRPRERNGSP